MSWYARTGPREKTPGKFRSRPKLGTDKTAGSRYRGWYYDFVTHRSASGSQRTRYAASILDPNRNRVAYIRDCATIQQATDAAKRWIDQALTPKDLRESAQAGF